MSSFRIVSLPRELQTASEVTWYVENVVSYGTVDSVDIINNVAPNGAHFSSAIVNMRDSDTWQNQRQKFLDASKSGIMANSFYISKSTGETSQFHFDNGKPMLHLKHVLNESNWMSIYIPVVPTDIETLQSEEEFKGFFENNLELGSVSRVDFVSRAVSDSASSVRSAYVHFNSWSINQTSNFIRTQIEGRGEFKCDGYYTGNQFNRFPNRRFMVFKMNKNPIPEANPEANIHQLSARNAELEALVEELNAKLIMLETMNETLNEKLGQSQIEAACLWNVMSEENDVKKGEMTMEELMV
uniref:Uncharacterized protein n=1 Tax=viral metagenome TaxID=1070528 RepID=A0A6C0B8Y7_9ZZZZ